RGAVRHRQPAADLALARLEHDLALARGDDALFVRRVDRGDPLERHRSVDLRLALRLGGDAGRGSADVERAERELRPGLTDGLRGQDPDGLSDVHRLHGGQVAAVALTADAAL